MLYYVITKEHMEEGDWMKKNGTLSIRIDDLTKDGLKILANFYKVTQSELIRWLILKEVKKLDEEIKRRNEQ